MKSKILITLILAAFIFPFANAQDLISVKDASKKLKDKNTVIVACVKPADYKKVHIPNSVNIYHKDLCNNEPIKSIIKSPDELAKIFGKAGIDNSKSVILYDAGSYKYAGRIYWAMKYLGIKDVKILNGNIDAWKKGRKPLTKNATKTKAATFTPAVNAKAMANFSDVTAGKAILVDVRPKGEFNGTEGKDETVKGHLKGAINFHFEDVKAANGQIKSKEQLTAMFNKAGITADKEIILYCTSSVRAGIVYMVLTSILNYQNVKVYDGAVYEWVAKGKGLVK
ncbi:MAG: sulfurtransferase [Bacteroidota bacterium]|nr:sulfurtransferase [Bacteroidota bacterium]